MCNVPALIINGILRLGELAGEPDDVFTHEHAPLYHLYWKSKLTFIFRERREHQVFKQLLQMIPGLEDRIMEGTNEYIKHTGELVLLYLSPVPFSVADIYSDPERCCAGEV
jgi:hypothetical protein